MLLVFLRISAYNSWHCSSVVSTSSVWKNGSFSRVYRGRIRLRPQESGYFWNRIYVYGIGLRPHETSEFAHQNLVFLKPLFRVDYFLIRRLNGFVWQWFYLKAAKIAAYWASDRRLLCLRNWIEFHLFVHSFLTFIDKCIVPKNFFKTSLQLANKLEREASLLVLFYLI